MSCGGFHVSTSTNKTKNDVGARPRPQCRSRPSGVPSASPPSRLENKRGLGLRLQVRDVMLSRRGEQEGKRDEFIDHMVEGVGTWISGARSGVIRWGFMVLKKSVSSGDECCCEGPCIRKAILPRRQRL